MGNVDQTMPNKSIIKNNIKIKKKDKEKTATPIAPLVTEAMEPKKREGDTGVATAMTSPTLSREQNVKKRINDAVRRAVQRERKKNLRRKYVTGIYVSPSYMPATYISSYVSPTPYIGAPPAPSAYLPAPSAPSAYLPAPPAPSVYLPTPHAPSAYLPAPPAPSAYFPAPPAPSAYLPSGYIPSYLHTHT
ncbi:uncharacterized protein [Anoplolepis gracilipes]|uniref:uncharacterized protein n=1 Tax=Anoplolepis gracilipes TaxID=354296 RepID=UPI003B9F1530